MVPVVTLPELYSYSRLDQSMFRRLPRQSQLSQPLRTNGAGPDCRVRTAVEGSVEVPVYQDAVQEEPSPGGCREACTRV